MSQNSNTQPAKSILKKHDADTNDSTNIPSTSKHQHPDHLKFDESNIKATFHPADKDYGFMKIDEPKTPYNEYIDPEDGTEGFERQSSFIKSGPVTLDADLVSQKLMGISGGPSSATASADNEFQAKRKAHYQEFKVSKELQEQGASLKELETPKEEGKCMNTPVAPKSSKSYKKKK